MTTATSKLQMNYSLDVANLRNARIATIHGHPDRAIIVAYNHMSNTEYYPYNGFSDASILLAPSMGFDPENFDPTSSRTAEWVKQWSYPVETAERLVAEINR